MKTYRRCHICNEEIYILSENRIQEIISEYVLNLKCHFHYKKHKVKFLKNKGIIKCLAVFILALIYTIIALPIWAITFPFWWIHENIN